MKRSTNYLDFLETCPSRLSIPAKQIKEWLVISRTGWDSIPVGTGIDSKPYCPWNSETTCCRVLVQIFYSLSNIANLGFAKLNFLGFNDHMLVALLSEIQLHFFRTGYSDWISWQFAKWYWACKGVGDVYFELYIEHSTWKVFDSISNLFIVFT